MNDYLLGSRKPVTDLKKFPVTPVKSTLPPESGNLLPTNPSPLPEAKATVKNDVSEDYT